MQKLWRILILCLFFEAVEQKRGVGYTFYRMMRDTRNKLPMTRRLFGGESVNSWEYPALVVLVDHSMSAMCSGAVISNRWVVTAAHCATPEIAYVLYNFKSIVKSDLAPVHLLYQHPEYRAVISDEGNGMDVVILHHDVGLIRTRTKMHLQPASRSHDREYEYPNVEVFEGMKKYATEDIMSNEVKILGYGQTEVSSRGAELRLVKLKVTECDRSPEEWQHCACGEGDARGVCAGDSGGPVMYEGEQVGVTSLGPTECSAVFLFRDGKRLPQVAYSVFTSLKPYVNVLNDTVYQTENTVKMKEQAVGRYPLQWGGSSPNSAERLHLFRIVLCGCYAWVMLN